MPKRVLQGVVVSDKNEFKEGEIVWIEECPPISKQKRWVVLPRERAAG